MSKEKKSVSHTKSAAEHLKDRGGQEKPVYAAVKTNYFCREPYRAVLLKNIRPDGTITIKQKININDVMTDKDIIYHKVKIIEPSINAVDIREWCAMRNREVQKNIERAEEAKRREMERERIEREREMERERIIGATQAKIILKEVAIRKRMMDEVMTGEQHLPAHMTRL